MSNNGTDQGSAKVSGLDAYEVIGTIGQGSFGKVSKVRRKADQRILVWKEVNYGGMREKEKQLIVSEVNILRELKHPFIVRYYDRIIDKASTKLYIVMEYCENGDLGSIIKQAKKTGRLLDEAFIWRVFSQVLLGLKHCHRHRDSTGKTKSILHRDLKPGNIFLDSQHFAKVGDFGLAKELTNDSLYAYTNVGTPFYMSPEMIGEEKYNEKCDVWALGCLLYELAALAPPFVAENHLSLAVKIKQGNFDRIPDRFSDDLHRTIRWMLHLNSDDRPSVDQLERIPNLQPHLQFSNKHIQECTRARADMAAIPQPVAPAQALTPEQQKFEEVYQARLAALAKAEEELLRKNQEFERKLAELQAYEASLIARENELQRKFGVA